MFQASRGNPGGKLPVWGSFRLWKAATSRRTPNARATSLRNVVKNAGWHTVSG